MENSPYIKFYTSFREYCDDEDHIYLDSHNTLKAKTNLEKLKNPEVATHPIPKEAIYSFFGCIIQTQIPNIEDNKTWSIRINYPNKENLEKLVKTLGLPNNSSED